MLETTDRYILLVFSNTLFLILLLFFTLISYGEMFAYDIPWQDDFNDNYIDNTFWNVYYLGFGPTVNETNGRLEIIIPQYSTDDSQQLVFRGGFYNKCKLRGDFDIQVDYEILNWSYQNGVRFGLATMQDPLITRIPNVVSRISFGNPFTDSPGPPRDVYLTKFGDNNFQQIATNDFSGKLKLKRINNSINGYYFDQNNWHLIDDAFISTEDIGFGIFAWSHDLHFTNQTVHIAFDNFKINQGQLLCIDAPYSSQKDPRWNGEDDEYDFTGESIEQLGCALTTATMVMNYHGIDRLPDEEATPLNVLNLNNWLNENPDGWWRQGMTSWGALTRLTRELHDIDDNYPVLEYKTISKSNSSEIDRILDDERHPLIFKESSSVSPSGNHFVVVNGIINSPSDYAILDPLNAQRREFIMPPDDLIDIRYLYPKVEPSDELFIIKNLIENNVSEPNLSYIFLHADENLHSLITTPDEEDIGVDENGQEINETNDYSFTLELPLNDDVNNIPNGEKYWELPAPKPIDGQYELALHADEAGWYEAEIYAYDIDANADVYKLNFYLDSNQTRFYTLDYNQEGYPDFSSLKNDFETFKNDIWDMYELGLIAHKGIAKQLIRFIELAEKFSPANPKQAKHFFDMFEHQLGNLHPKHINNQAHDFLLQELEFLKASI